MKKPDENNSKRMIVEYKKAVKPAKRLKPKYRKPILLWSKLKDQIISVKKTLVIANKTLNRRISAAKKYGRNDSTVSLGILVTVAFQYFIGTIHLPFSWYWVAIPWVLLVYYNLKHFFTN